MSFGVTSRGLIVPSSPADGGGDSVSQAIQRTLRAWAKAGRRTDAWIVVFTALHGRAPGRVTETTGPDGTVTVVFAPGHRS